MILNDEEMIQVASENAAFAIFMIPSALNISSKQKCKKLIIYLH